MTPKAKLNALDALTKSKGWVLLRETMERELLAAAMAIAKNPEMTEKEVDFRRGSIWAAERLLHLPETLRRSVETELLLESGDDR